MWALFECVYTRTLLHTLYYKRALFEEQAREVRQRTRGGGLSTSDATLQAEVDKVMDGLRKQLGCECTML